MPREQTSEWSTTLTWSGESNHPCCVGEDQIGAQDAFTIFMLHNWILLRFWCKVWFQGLIYLSNIVNLPSLSRIWRFSKTSTILDERVSWLLFFNARHAASRSRWSSFKSTPFSLSSCRLAKQDWEQDPSGSRDSFPFDRKQSKFLSSQCVRSSTTRLQRWHKD